MSVASASLDLGMSCKIISQLYHSCILEAGTSFLGWVSNSMLMLHAHVEVYLSVQKIHL